MIKVYYVHLWKCDNENWTINAAHVCIVHDFMSLGRTFPCTLLSELQNFACLHFTGEKTETKEMGSVLLSGKVLTQHDLSLRAPATGLVPLVGILGLPWSLSFILGPGRTVNLSFSTLHS